MSSDLCTWMRPLYSIKPSLRKRFMKKLTRDRVVPIISARVSCEICGIERFRLTGLAEFRHQQENPRQTLFAGVEKLIDKIGLGAHAAGQQKLQKQVGEVMLLVHHADHLIPLDLERSAGGNGSGRRQTQPRHRRERLFSDKIASGEEA